MFLPHSRVKVSIVGSLRDREVACSASDRQGSNFESCVWRAVSSQSSHHPQEVLLAQFSLYVHKGGLKPDSFHFIYSNCLAIWQFTRYQTLSELWPIVGHIELDPVNIFRVGLNPSLKLHILFYNNGLAIWHGLLDIRHIKANHEQ